MSEQINPRDVARYMAELEREFASDETMARRMLDRMQAEHDDADEVFNAMEELSRESDCTRRWANRVDCENTLLRDALCWWRGFALVGWAAAGALFVGVAAARWWR